jgi:hypothetical protein
MRLNEREGQALLARVAKAGMRITTSKSIAESLEQIAAKTGAVNRNAMQKRSKDDPYKSQAERDYAAYLEYERSLGHIERWEYEGIALRIDDGNGKTCSFWPDFTVWESRSAPPEFHEIKGKGKYALTPSARVKFLAARRLYPEFIFRCLQAPNWEPIL